MKQEETPSNDALLARLEKRRGGWLLTLAVPAETALIALEMLQDLCSGLQEPGDDARVAAAAGCLVGLFDDLRVRSVLDAVTTAPAAA